MQAGEYLLAVNGRNLTANENIHSFFQNTANKQIVIRVGPNTDRTARAKSQSCRCRTKAVCVPWHGSRESPQSGSDDWRQAGLRLAARHGRRWLHNFNRYYFAQLHKQGAVIDERFNGGGQAADYIIDYLEAAQQLLGSARRRGFPPTVRRFPGPKVMIINEYAGSGGDYMPWMFRRHTSVRSSESGPGADWLASAVIRC